MTAQQKKHLDELHFENVLHLNKLAFYKQEIEIFKKRLEEIALKNTKVEVTARIEQFQNQFIRQCEVIDELRHNVNEHEHSMAEQAKDNVAAHRLLFESNTGLNDNMTRFTELYVELKGNFMRFLSEWM